MQNGDILGAGDEAEDGQVLRCPEEPSQEEVEKHLAMGHPNFRSWCPHCVRGGGQAHDRRKKDGREDVIPKICVDYMTMSAPVLGQEENWKKGHNEHDVGNPIVVYTLKPVNWLGAHVAPEKG